MMRSTPPTAGQYTLYFFDITGLHFDLQVWFEVFPVGACLFDSFFQAAGIIDMIIFQHDHIIESEAVVDPSADPDGIFFQEAKVGSGLTGIQDPRAEFLQFVNILAGEGCHSAHSPHTTYKYPLPLPHYIDRPFL